MAAVALVHRLILAAAISVLPVQNTVHAQQQPAPQPRTGDPADGANEAQAWPMPPKMRFCDPTGCGTLTRGNGRYDGVYDDVPMTSFYAIGETPPHMVLYRVDRDGRTATLKGSVSQQGNRLLNGVITWDGGESLPFDLRWGSAINRVVRPRTLPKGR